MANRKLMNTKEMCSHLCEAKEALESMITEISTITYDSTYEMALANDYAHVFSHLCQSWHRKWLADEEIHQLDSEVCEVWEKMSRAIPDWTGDIEIVELAWQPCLEKS